MVRKCVWSGLTPVLGLAVPALAGHDETSAQSTAGLSRPVIIAYSQAGNPTHTDGDDAGYLNATRCRSVRMAVGSSTSTASATGRTSLPAA